MSDDSFFVRFLFLAVGAVLTWVLQQYRVARAEDISILNDHIKDVEKFTDAAVLYWITDPESLEKDKAASAKVLTTWLPVSRVYETVKKITASYDGQYQQLSLDLYLAATGGLFDSRTRKQDPDTALIVAEKSSSLVVYLRDKRHEVISFKALLRHPLERSRNSRLLPRDATMMVQSKVSNEAGSEVIRYGSRVTPPKSPLH